ncbi:hypothetical protein [Mesorhizobium sp. B2-4-9]|nr:hypothetical protein [Mesorhizobium sp. B2-4-9]
MGAIEMLCAPSRFYCAADGAWFNDLKKKQTDISQMRDTLIFG